MCCGVISTLLCYYCSSGCQASVVASLLTYRLDKSENGDTYVAVFLEKTTQARAASFDFTAHVITHAKTEVPLFCFRSKDAKYTIIFSHGNATDIGAMFFIYAMISLKLGVHVVAYDYTGYGHSRHNMPSEKQTYADIESVYDWCITSGLVTDPSKEIVLYGQSVGSGPSCYLATKRPVSGLIIHSGIMSGIRVLTDSRALWCFDIYPNIDRIKTCSCPVLVIHGTHDEEVQFKHGLGLYEAVPSKYKTEPWWVDDRGHNDILEGNEKIFFRKLGSFLRSLGSLENSRLSVESLPPMKYNDVMMMKNGPEGLSSDDKIMMRMDRSDHLEEDELEPGRYDEDEQDSPIPSSVGRRRLAGDVASSPAKTSTRPSSFLDLACSHESAKPASSQGFVTLLAHGGETAGAVEMVGADTGRDESLFSLDLDSADLLLRTPSPKPTPDRTRNSVSARDTVYPAATATAPEQALQQHQHQQGQKVQRGDKIGGGESNDVCTDYSYKSIQKNDDRSFIYRGQHNDRSPYLA